jgi:general secretion pathway protein I
MNQYRKMSHTTGFTLIEVLLALAVVAIALTALLRASSQNVAHMSQIKDKSISHWVAMQGVTAIQLGLIPIQSNQDISQVTTMLGQRWYWRAKFAPTPVKNTQLITIVTSRKSSGPFRDKLFAYRYMP